LNDSELKFEQTLYKPLVQLLGYEYSDSHSADMSLLRTRSISQAAAAGDKEYDGFRLFFDLLNC
jgi:hypothetical protein